MQDRVPAQQLWSSANQISASPTMPISSLVASPQYVQQYRTLMDHQRQVFEEERALWHTERSEMQEKIARLEASLGLYQAGCSSQGSSPIEPNGSGQSGSWNYYNGVTKRFTGDEFWRGPGGKNDAHPTRTFANPADQSLNVENRLPVIVEESMAYRPKVASFSISSINSRPLGKASTRGIGTDKDLDGITFRKSTLGPNITESLMTSQVSLPHQSPSPTGVSSGSMPKPSSLSIALPDPYTKDAGHTPLARKSECTLDGVSGTVSGGLATPIQPELERPPLEPHASAIQVPSERADSYFPTSTEGDNDGDTELHEPLGLKDNCVANDEFLNMVDSKLLQVAQSKTSDPSESDKENIGEGKSFEQPEPEPQLRIKKSMNFGSQFGASSCGKGF
ncbi:hypothetical protein MMC29_006289 [Sticta canariensis]|nr:hypothetical protein [Sticta canariensis]